MNLTKNFTIHELIFSVTANANNIDNRPSIAAIANLKALCINVLQPLRDYLKCSVIVTSGYRSIILNKKIGGQANSQHLTGHAADIIVPQRDLKEVYNYIKHHLPYDQLLYESNKTDKWIHISYRSDGNNRKQAFDNYKV